jgi:lipid II:glycine glycyltransferase (peptidoglycan interpeptide bridge formation enzyme)
MQAFVGPASDWNRLIAGLPRPHLLQTWEWAQVKAKYGWQALPCVWTSGAGPVAAAMVLKRTLPAAGFARRMAVLYLPKGPLLDWSEASLRRRVLDDLQAFARSQGAIFVKIDPDVVLGTGVPGNAQAVEDPAGETVRSDLGRQRWLFSQDQVQFRNTVLIDLRPSEEGMLERMRQKARYNVRLAARKGVSVRPGRLDDLSMLYRMYAETSVRDGFIIREEGYYQTVWRTFGQPPSINPPASLPFSEPLIAEVNGEPVAAVSLFYFAGTAYYLFGMSRDAHREKMPNSLLQWEAMRRAKAYGCGSYNLWGAPDDFDQDDGLWGVFRFKEGLGGTVQRTIGAWDFPASPLLYKLYTQVLPRLLDLMRWRGRKRTQQSIGV